MGLWYQHVGVPVPISISNQLWVITKFMISQPSIIRTWQPCELVIC